MKPASRYIATLAAIATTSISAIAALAPDAHATQFGQQEVDANRFIAIAAPVGSTSHQLLILEQLNDRRPCWRESGNGSGAIAVEPLLLNFDFTGICNRSTDSNGYSVRTAGEDLGWQYSLRIVENGNDLKLVAVSNRDRSAPPIEVGRTNGTVDGFAKIELNPGWRLTKRVYNGQALGHVYLTHDQDLPTLIAAATPSRPTVPTPAAPTPSRPTPVATRPTPPTPTAPSSSDRPPIVVPTTRPNVTPSPQLPPPVVVPTTRPGSSPGGSAALPPIRVTPTPQPRPSAPDRIYEGIPPSPSPVASQLGFNYRVIVPASTTAMQERVRAAIPGAFRTTLNGQVVMQTGLFRTQPDAEEFRQQLSRQNLTATVVPIATATAPIPQRPSTSSPQNDLPQVPRGRIVAVIDPGHGGRDPGAVGIGGLQEKEITFAISREVASILERQGVQAILTRQDDREVDLAPRVSLAERADANLFVSIHANALSMSRPDVNGLETYYYDTGGGLARSIHNSIMRDIDMNDRGVKQARFYVLRNTTMPAALVEVGFVTGRDDAARLRSPEFRNRMAGAIARGILQYIQTQ